MGKQTKYTAPYTRNAARREMRRESAGGGRHASHDQTLGRSVTKRVNTACLVWGNLHLKTTLLYLICQPAEARSWNLEIQAVVVGTHKWGRNKV